MKRLFGIKHVKTISKNIESVSTDEADKALGGYREFKPSIYEFKERSEKWGGVSILLDSMK